MGTLSIAVNARRVACLKNKKKKNQQRRGNKNSFAAGRLCFAGLNYHKYLLRGWIRGEQRHRSEPRYKLFNEVKTNYTTMCSTNGHGHEWAGLPFIGFRARANNSSILNVNEPVNFLYISRQQSHQRDLFGLVRLLWSRPPRKPHTVAELIPVFARRVNNYQRRRENASTGPELTVKLFDSLVSFCWIRSF